MSTAIDQKAYLQKYLAGPSKDKKKKKKKAVKGKGIKLIDDDIDLSKLRALDGDELDILDQGEDAPVIAGIIDERPEDIKKLDQFKTNSKWRVINQDDGFNSKLQIEEIRRDIKEVEKENEIIFGKMYSDSEDERQKNSDQSPPRKKKSSKNENDRDISPPKNRNQSPKNGNDSDVSLPRNRSHKQDNDSDVSPPRKRGQSPKRDTKYDSDASPPRKQESRKERKKPSRWGNASPEAGNSPSLRRDNFKKSNRSPSLDMSPPRKKKNYNSDASPPRKSKNMNKSDSDISPPRQKTDKRKQSPQSRDSRKHSPDGNKRKRNRDEEIPPSRRDRHCNRSDRDRNITDRDKRNKRQDSDSDLSPPRKDRDRNNSGRDRISERDRDISKGKRRKSPSPQNSKRKENSDSDMSPPRREKNRNESGRDRSMLLSRRKHNSDSDLSPPRRKDKNMLKRDRDISERDRYKSEKERNKYNDSPPPSNTKMAKTLEGKKAGLQDARQLRDENEEFRRKEDEVFSRLADEVSGKNAQVVKRKGKRETSEDRSKQKEKAERQKEIDAKYKMWSKGLKQVEEQQARTADFLHEAAKPLARHRDDGDLERSLQQAERAGDPMLQYIRDKKRERGELPPEKPMYKGNFPPNRFNIRPGHRWDGVDRSNGYEKKYFEQQSKRKAQEEEAYKWSTEDL